MMTKSLCSIFKFASELYTYNLFIHSAIDFSVFEFIPRVFSSILFNGSNHLALIPFIFLLWMSANRFLRIDNIWPAKERDYNMINDPANFIGRELDGHLTNCQVTLIPLKYLPKTYISRNEISMAS